MLATLTFGYNFHLFLHEEIAVYAIKLYWPLCELCNASMNVMMLSVIYSRYREWCALVCDACSRNVDVDADRQKKIRSLWNVDMEKNWKISWLDKVTNEEVLRSVNKDRQIMNSGNGNIDGLAMFWDTMDFCMKLLKAEWKVNQQDGEEFSCYMIGKWW